MHARAARAGSSSFLMLCQSWAVAACANDFAEYRTKGGIQGRITSQVAVPASGVDLSVAAFSSFPPSAPPNSMWTVSAYGIPGNGLGYELRGLPAYRYYVVAEMVSLATGQSLGAGGYPSYCALSDAAGPVTVAEVTTVDGVDVAIYAQGGTSDPCFGAPNDVCPNPGRSTLALALSSRATATADDAVLMAVFPAWPANTVPVTFKVVPGEAAIFPLTIIDNNLVPGSYAVYACLDRGADDLRGMCGDEDDWAALGEGQTVPFEADRVTRVTLDLDSGDGGYDAPVVASELGCG